MAEISAPLLRMQGRDEHYDQCWSVLSQAESLITFIWWPAKKKKLTRAQLWLAQTFLDMSSLSSPLLRTLWLPADRNSRATRCPNIPTKPNVRAQTKTAACLNTGGNQRRQIASNFTRTNATARKQERRRWSTPNQEPLLARGGAPLS